MAKKATKFEHWFEHWDDWAKSYPKNSVVPLNYLMYNGNHDIGDSWIDPEGTTWFIDVIDGIAYTHSIAYTKVS
jgi:hypothetical protein